MGGGTAPRASPGSAHFQHPYTPSLQVFPLQTRKWCWWENVCGQGAADFLRTTWSPWEHLEPLRDQLEPLGSTWKPGG